MTSPHTYIKTNPRMQRVRRLTTLMIGLTALFCVYWSVNILIFIAGFIFGDGMQTNVWVDEGVTITFGQRSSYFVLLLIVAGLAWSTFYAAFQMLKALRQGAFFAVETCRRVQVFGAFLIATFVSDTVLTTLGVTIVTWNNPVDGAVGFMAPTYYFNSTTITVMLCGLGFFIVGWVLHEGAQMAEENEGFI